MPVFQQNMAKFFWTKKRLCPKRQQIRSGEKKSVLLGKQRKILFDKPAKILQNKQYLIIIYKRKVE